MLVRLLLRKSIFQEARENLQVLLMRKPVTIINK